MSAEVFAVVLVCCLVAMVSCIALAIGFAVHARVMSERLADRSVERALLDNQQTLIDAIVLPKEDQIRRITRDRTEHENGTLAFTPGGEREWETVGSGRDSPIE